MSDVNAPMTEPEEPGPAVQLSHITKIIIPTIMMASKGGFIVTIPGLGVAAFTTLEEAITFINEYVHKECFGSGRDVPRVLRGVADAFRTRDTASALMMCVGILTAGFLAAIKFGWLV